MKKARMRITQYADIDATKENVKSLIEAYNDKVLDPRCNYFVEIKDSKLLLIKMNPDGDLEEPTKEESEVAGLLYFIKKASE